MDHVENEENVGGVKLSFGEKPTNFFSLLAAAVSKAKIEKHAPEFVQFLAHSGIKNAWIRAIVALYEEPKKPDDPLSYLLKLMGWGIPQLADIGLMQTQVKELRSKVLELQAERDGLRQALEEADRQKQELGEFPDEDKYFSDYDSDEDMKGTCYKS